MQHNKHKLIFITTAPLVAGVVAVSMYAWGALHYIEPVTPTFTYDNPAQQQKATTGQPDDADTSTSDRRQAAAQTLPDAPAATQPTANDLAPAQTAVRAQVAKEYTYHPLATANDPGYAANWALQKTNAPAAWDVSTGSESTTIAVIDTGYALDHQDLTDRWHVNSAETGQTTSGSNCWTGTPADKQSNGCDDDANGYVDDWRGWNFYLGDNNPMAGRQNPTGAAVSHGTETAGLAGASGNNNLGMTTLNWRTKLMPLQVLSDDGPGYTSDVVAAIRYAADNGADVINLSLGAYEYDPAVKTAVDYAVTRNVVVVAAAGNCGTADASCEGYPVGTMTYPALHPTVIAVGATTQADNRASFSSYGPALDIVAPGSGTITTTSWSSTNPTDLYAGAVYGTSYASPQVASLVSLIKAIRPDTSVRDITALVAGTATKSTGMSGRPYTQQLGHGIINASAALAVATALNITSAQPELLQAGGVTSEHIVKPTDVLGSGCKAAVRTYCAVRLLEQSTSHERYLPYLKTGDDGATGWTWAGAILESGTWSARSLQGEQQSSTPYYLLAR